MNWLFEAKKRYGLRVLNYMATSLPLGFLLGFFTFIINAMRLKMVSGMVPGFYLHGFWPAVFGSLIISLVSWMPSSFLNERRQDQLYR